MCNLRVGFNYNFLLSINSIWCFRRNYAYAPINVKQEQGILATIGNLIVTYFPMVGILIGCHAPRVGNFGIVTILDNGASLEMSCHLVKYPEGIWKSNKADRKVSKNVFFCFPSPTFFYFNACSYIFNIDLSILQEHTVFPLDFEGNPSAELAWEKFPYYHFL